MALASQLRILRVLFCAGGIYSAYLTQGIISERLATDEFGGGRFAHMSALPWFQSLACFACGYAMLKAPGLGGGDTGVRGVPPVSAYWRAALTASVGPSLGFMSLRNINYVAQVVVKSCKMLPVMLVGAVVHKVQYRPLQYLVALMLCTGLVIFSAESSPKATSKLANPNLPLGFSLCVGNLLLDGYTNSAEDEINKKYAKSTGVQMMCWINFWCFLYYSVGFFTMELLGMSDTFSGALSFVLLQPQGRYLVLQFCLCGAFGQLFIFYTIRQYGSLMNTLVCTTRKFFSILLSVVLNGTVLLPTQWVGVLLVFSGIAWSIQLKEQEKRARSLVKENGKAAVEAGKELSKGAPEGGASSIDAVLLPSSAGKNGVKLRNGFSTAS